MSDDVPKQPSNKDASAFTTIGMGSIDLSHDGAQGTPPTAAQASPLPFIGNVLGTWTLTNTTRIIVAVGVCAVVLFGIAFIHFPSDRVNTVMHLSKYKSEAPPPDLKSRYAL